jgi:hypothetical protein
MGVAICFTPSPSPVPELGTCQFINDCADMQECYQDPYGGLCLWYCALTGPKTSQPPGLGGCPMGETCQSSYAGSTFKLGVSNVGLCIPNAGLPTPDAGAKDAGSHDAGPDASDAGGDAGEPDAGIKDAAANG